MSVSSASDERLLAAARAGDDAAFAELVERYDEPLHTLVYRILDGHGAETVLQGAYAKAYRARHRQSGRVRPWLVRRALLEALEEGERRRRRRTGGYGRKPSREEVAPAADAGPLGELPSDQRAVVVMVDELGWRLEEVAEVLATDPQAAGRLLRRGRRALAGLADDHPADEPADLAIPPPTHSPGYWDEVGRCLLEEAERPPAAAAPPVVAEAEAARARPHHDPSTGSQQAVVVAPEDGVDRLARGAERLRRRRRWDSARVLRWGGLALVVALVGTGLVLLILKAAGTRSPVREGSVGELAGRVEEMLASGGGFDATVERTDVDNGREVGSTWLVVSRPDGSWFVQGPERGARFDAAAGVLQARTQSPTSATFTETRNLAAAPPFPDPSDAALPHQDLATALRALVDEDDERAQVQGEGADQTWVLEGALDGPAVTGGPDRVTMVLDKATLVPREVAFRRGEQVVRRLVFSSANLEAAGPLPDLAPPPGVTPTTLDQGFAAVTLAQVPALAGSAPPRPAWLPPGMELQRVTVRASDKAVSLRYGRGVSRVNLSVRPQEGEGPGEDPFPTAALTGPTHERTLDGGRFRGSTVVVRAAAGGPSQLWGVADGVAFTVSGDVPTDDLVRVAESLR